jgi:hypothetical protein
VPGGKRAYLTKIYRKENNCFLYLFIKSLPKSPLYFRHSFLGSTANPNKKIANPNKKLQIQIKKT